MHLEENMFEDNEYIYEDQWVYIEDIEKFKENASDWLEEIVHQVYNIGNVSMLEEALEELCGMFDVNLPKGKAKLQRKKNELFELGLTLSKNIPSVEEE